jgi:hypothetical protein
LRLATPRTRGDDETEREDCDLLLRSHNAGSEKCRAAKISVTGKKERKSGVRGGEGRESCGWNIRLQLSKRRGVRSAKPRKREHRNEPPQLAFTSLQHTDHFHFWWIIYLSANSC